MPNDSYEHYLYETACAKDAQKLLEEDVLYIRSQAAIKNQELRDKLCDIEQSFLLLSIECGIIPGLSGRSTRTSVGLKS